jgi:hypothetical protein
MGSLRKRPLERPRSRRDYYIKMAKEKKGNAIQVSGREGP